jgi:putative transposase
MKKRRNKLYIFTHFVWATYDRLPLITQDIEREVYRYIEQVCKEDGCEVFAVGGMPDHMHVLITMPNTIAIGDLMQHIKGGSLRLISKTLKPGEWFKWQRHYAGFSVAIRDRRKVIAYIENQKQHHAEGTLWPEAEETFEEYELDTTADDSEPDE